MTVLRTPTAPVALAVDGVSKQYVRRTWTWRKHSGTGPYALRDVSFDVREGEVLGLLGPNGAGKTTLLKVMSTMLYPDAGSVSLFGEDVLRQPDRARRLMGLVTSDERSFYWRLSGRHNLLFFAALYGVPPKIASERVDMLLETLGLTAAAEQAFHGYSSGMKQKLAIARGLLADPRLILYDEPTRALDPLSANNIRQWIADKRKRSPRQTHLVATNLLNEAEQLCDRVIIINHGSIIAIGTIPEIRAQWQAGDVAVHTISYRGNVPASRLLADPELGIFSVTAADTDGDVRTIRVQAEGSGAALSHILQAILGSGAKVLRCESETPSFDEVFCSIVRNRPKEAVAAR